MTRFVAVYEGPTLSAARLLAVSADERIVNKFFEELLREVPADEFEATREDAQILTLSRTEREDG